MCVSGGGRVGKESWLVIQWENNYVCIKGSEKSEYEYIIGGECQSHCMETIGREGETRGEIYKELQ